MLDFYNLKYPISILLVVLIILIKSIDILPNALEIAGNNYYQSWNNHVAHRVAIWDLTTEKVKQHSENAGFYLNNGLTKKQFSFEAIFFHERPKMTKKCQKWVKNHKNVKICENNILHFYKASDHVWMNSICQTKSKT